MDNNDAPAYLVAYETTDSNGVMITSGRIDVRLRDLPADIAALSELEMLLALKLSTDGGHLPPGHRVTVTSWSPFAA